MPSFSCCTWNVENLFRPGEGDGPADADLYRAKLAYVAGELRALAADVVALQEIGSAEALSDRRSPPTTRTPWPQPTRIGAASGWPSSRA